MERRRASTRRGVLGGISGFAASAAVLLVLPGIAPGAATGLSFRAPYGLTGLSTGHARGLFGCATTAKARELTAPTFNNTTGRFALGTTAKTGCGAPTTSWAWARETVRVDLANFGVPASGAYWVNVTVAWSLLYTFWDSTSGRSTYSIWINATLRDNTTGAGKPLTLLGSTGTAYNATGTSAGVLLVGGTAKVPVRFARSLHLRAGDQYLIKVTVSVVASAQALGNGSALTKADLYSGGRGVWLRGASVR